MEANAAAWNSPPEIPENLESSLHKVSVFVNKCRALSASNAGDIERDAPKLRLDKYLSELTDALGTAAPKLSKPSDITAFCRVFGTLHRQLGAQFTTIALPKVLKEVDATGKPRTLVRFTLEFYFAGVLREHDVAKRALQRALNPDKSAPSATVKMLKSFKSIDEFRPQLEKYISTLEIWLEPQSKESDRLLLSEELDKINEEHKEMLDNVEAYKQVCAMLDKVPAAQFRSLSTGTDGTSSASSLSTTHSPAPSTPPPPSSISGSRSQAHTPTPGTLTPSNCTSPAVSAPKWSLYEHQLNTMNNRKKVLAAAAALSNDSSTQKKTINLLLDSPKVHMLYWYALFIAHAPAIKDRTVPEVLKQALENQLFLKYAAELAKTGVISADQAVDILIKLTRPFQPEAVFTFSESCGQFLLERTPTRVADYRDYLRKLPAATPQERQLIEGSASYLAPSQQQVSSKGISGSANVETFVEHLLCRDLAKNTYTPIRSILFKLKRTELINMVPLFTDRSDISVDNLVLLIQLVVELSAACPAFAFRVLDRSTNNFFVGLSNEDNNRQTLVFEAIYLANLQVYGLVTPALVNIVVDSILAVESSAFRLKLACIYASCCDFHEFDVTSISAKLTQYRNQVECDPDLVAMLNRTFTKLASHEPPPPPLHNSEGEEEDEEDEKFEQPSSDEEEMVESLGEEEGEEDEYDDDDDEFEKEFEKLATAPGGSASVPTSTPPAPKATPVPFNLAALRIAKR